MAYNVHLRQVVGGPSWMENDKFDVTGRPSGRGRSQHRPAARVAPQSASTERFKLTVHTDKKELPAYVLTVGPRGHKLTANTTNPNGLPAMLIPRSRQFARWSTQRWEISRAS